MNAPQKSANVARATCRRPIAPLEVFPLEALAGRLRELRTAAGLSRMELAESAELAPSTVERIERATRRTRRSTLERIAKVLDADASQLADLAGPALAPESDYAERVSRRRARRTQRQRNRDEWAERTRALAEEREVGAALVAATRALVAPSSTRDLRIALDMLKDVLARTG